MISVALFIEIIYTNVLGKTIPKNYGTCRGEVSIELFRLDALFIHSPLSNYIGLPKLSEVLLPCFLW
jgi:hypothetical protein